MPSLPIDRTRLLLGIDAGFGPRATVSDQLRGALKTLGLYVEGTARGEFLRKVHHTNRHVWVRGLKGRAIPSDRVRQLPGVLGPGLRWVGPVERHGKVLVAALQDALVIKPRPHVDPEHLSRVLSAFGLREWPEKSRFLGHWRYFVIEHPLVTGATETAAAVLKSAGAIVDHVNLEYLSHAPACTLEPTDLFYDRQWAPARIGAPAAWNVATGRGVIVAVIDSGVELDHPDLNLLNRGINLEDMVSEASPVGVTLEERSHGTQVAGIAGAQLNFTGVAGIAGGCQILPLAADTFTHAAVAVGIRVAMDQGARVVNMSFQTPELNFLVSPARDAIEDAAAAGLVLCASSGNHNDPSLILPARHPDVMACGGSDESDRRWLSSPTLGSGYGDATFLGRSVGVSVVAPGLNVFTTDLVGTDGMNPGASPYGDYAHFNATSAATPHVSGVAAVLMSADPSLAATEVRRIIERTAEKVGGYAYADVLGYSSGSRHREMGYGRLHAFRAVDLGDVMIADWPDDDGVEPSTPHGGVFWTRSDIVIRPADDGMFDPTNPAESSALQRGFDHAVYVRVRNRGPAVARNVHVEVRVTPWVGTEFVYPVDWVADDTLHLRPTPVEADFSTIGPGESRLARFTLTAAQADGAVGWRDTMPWHPCVLGVATADNDYAFAAAAGGAALQMPRNNLAQRNLTVPSPEMRSAEWPFVIGHPADKERAIDLVIDAGRLARDGHVRLVLDDNQGAFPVVSSAKGWASGTVRVVTLAGGKPTAGEKGAARGIIMTSSRLIVRLALSRPGRYPLRLVVRRPRGARAGERFQVAVAQHSLRRGLVGGAGLLL